MRPATAVLAAAAIVAALAGCGDDGIETAVPYSATQWPSGDSVSISEFDGRPVLLAGWATWCAPCERELPLLDEFAGSRRAGQLEIIAVNVDAPDVDDDAIDSMLARLGVDLPVWRDENQSLLSSYEGVFMPFSVLLDRDGLVVEAWSGAIDVDSTRFAAAIAEAES